MTDETYRRYMHLGFNAKKNPFFLDKENLIHVLSLGKTRSGKSVFLKNISEEFLLRDVPVIIIDPQGDMVTMANTGKFDKKNNFSDYIKINFSKVEKRVFTPLSNSGIPLSISPFKSKDKVAEMDDIEYRKYIDVVSTALTELTNTYNADQFTQIHGDIYDVLDENVITSMSKLMKLLDSKSYAYKKLAKIYTGSNKILFDNGIPLDMDILMNGLLKNKVPLNLIYLPSLSSLVHKQLFISSILSSIYSYMLAHPSTNHQLLLVVDEAAAFIPSGAKKPISKPIMERLIKEGRKFGLCVAMASQNLTDLDYKLAGQCNIISMGKFTARQDLSHAKKIIKSVMSNTNKQIDIDKYLNELAIVKPGEMKIVTPDESKTIRNVKVRWTHSPHGYVVDPKDLPKLNKRYVSDYFKKGIIPNESELIKEERKILRMIAKGSITRQNDTKEYYHTKPGDIQVKFCNYCFEEVKKDLQYCPHCFTRF